MVLLYLDCFIARLIARPQVAQDSEIYGSVGNFNTKLRSKTEFVLSIINYLDQSNRRKFKCSERTLQKIEEASGADVSDFRET